MECGPVIIEKMISNKLIIIIQDGEDKLQRSIHIFSQMTREYNLKISSSKTKIMAFRGKHLIRSKIVIDCINNRTSQPIQLFRMRAESCGRNRSG